MNSNFMAFDFNICFKLQIKLNDDREFEFSSKSSEIKNNLGY